jgi:16S rRNA (guanine966-N2)-methyltransferase
LFNWLGPRIVGARCLDLFAGSGALGLEALSRGAASVVFVESDATAASELQARLVEWNAVGASVERTDALRFLAGTTRNFDIVFLDPPFATDILPAAADLLERQGRMAPGALIYIETSACAGLPALPAQWRQVKAKRAGEVGYHLYERSARGGAAP